MVLFPNCKINLGLRVLGSRPDNYHDLETIFFPIPLYDAAELVQSPASRKAFQLHTSGITLEGKDTDNLCYRAWELVNADNKGMPPLSMYLHKAIPPGAGLGGGSSNAVFTLKLINELLHLKLSNEQLLAYALKLGSDCPFFVYNSPCHATGRGELLAPVDLELNEYYFFLVNPGIHVSTAWAFGELSRMRTEATQRQEATASNMKLPEIIKMPVALWKGQLINDFEEPVFGKYPELSKIKSDLYESGAVFASMTGTGSCLYGLFQNNVPAPIRKFSNRYKVHHLKKSH